MEQKLWTFMVAWDFLAPHKNSKIFSFIPLPFFLANLRDFFQRLMKCRCTLADNVCVWWNHQRLHILNSVSFKCLIYDKKKIFLKNLSFLLLSWTDIFFFISLLSVKGSTISKSEIYYETHQVFSLWNESTKFNSLEVCKF